MAYDVLQYLYCAQLGAPWGKSVGALSFRAVSQLNRDLWYPVVFLFLSLPVHFSNIFNHDFESFSSRLWYSGIPGHRNCHIETKVWNWAGFFTVL